MHRSTESPPIQTAWPANDVGMALADATASQLMCALRARLERMPAERRSLNAKLAAISLINIANRKAQS